MQEKLLSRLNEMAVKIKEISNKLDKRNRIIIVASVILILVVAIVGAVVLNSASNAILFTQLTQEEAAEIVTKVGELGVEASYNSDGSVTVPAERVDELRAKLVLMGYPKNGLSYKTFTENVDVLSTDFDKNAYAIYDLQDRVAATIRCFDGVSDAVVVFSLGGDNKYVIAKDKKDTTAWATVYMKPGAVLEEDQVKGIQRLLAKSIAGLKEENVSVFDGNGRDLTLIISDQGTNGTTKLKRALEQDIENSVNAKILNLLGPLYGQENVRVSVTAKVDVKKKIQENVVYTPTTPDNKGIVSSEMTGQEVTGAGTVTQGPPGTDTNAQVPLYPNVTYDGQDIYFKDDKSFEYLVSQMKEQIQDDGGDVIDMSISAVINSNEMKDGEISDVKELIASVADGAVGIEPEEMLQKVTVMTGTFTTGGSAEGGWNITLLTEAAAEWKWIALLAVILAGLATLLASRMRGRRAARIAEEEERLLLDAANAKAAEADLMSKRLEELKKTREMELKEQIVDFAEINPEISAQLIRTWLKGDGAGNE